MPAPLPPGDEEAVIALHFEGDRALYAEYKAMCRTQFTVDAAEGDAACLAGDMRALQLLAHSLKTVFRSLGYTDLAIEAEAIEHQAGHGIPEAACALWPSLRDALRHLTA